MKQKTDEWFAERVNRVTASRAGAILGVSPYSTPDDVMREMVREHFGAEREFLGNVATQWGDDHEDDAILALESELALMVEKCGLIVHPEYDWLAASPDGLVGNDMVVEVKAPYSQRLFSIYDRPDYAAQVQIQMACAGRRKGVFSVWTKTNPESTEPSTSIEFINYDAQWFEEALETLRLFHQFYIQIIADKELSAPYLEDLVQDMTGDKGWGDAAVGYQYAVKELAVAQALVDDRKAALIELANGRKSAGAGVLVYPIKGRITTDYKKAIKDYCPDADLEQYKKTGSPSWGVRSEK